MPGGRRLEQVGLAGLILMFLIPFLPSWLFDSGRSNTGRAATSAACAACPGPWTALRDHGLVGDAVGAPRFAGCLGPSRRFVPNCARWSHRPSSNTTKVVIGKADSLLGAGRSNALFHRCAAQEVASSTCRRPGNLLVRPGFHPFSDDTGVVIMLPGACPQPARSKSASERRFCWSRGR
jgi:hypothetical protein